MRKLYRFAALCLALCALAAGAGCAAPLPGPTGLPEVSGAPVGAADSGTPFSLAAKNADAGSAQMDIPAIAAELIPSVVGIATVSKSADGTAQGLGTGVIAHEDGYIITNHHVAGDAAELMAIFHDGTFVEGKTLWSDAALDLAVVKIESGHKAATLGSSDDIVVGEGVLAIGTPPTLSFQHTVTAGIISAVNRTLNVPTAKGETFLENLIQTDTSINPGNSGGPLINARGEVVGIITVKVTQAEGIGFAIPIDIAKSIVDHFISEGKFQTPYLGIFAFDSQLARYYGEDMGGASGLYVMNADEYGPAYRAGVRKGDVVLSADGIALHTMLDLRRAMYAKNIGDTIALRVLRDGQEVEFGAALGNTPLRE